MLQPTHRGGSHSRHEKIKLAIPVEVSCGVPHPKGFGIVHQLIGAICKQPLSVIFIDIHSCKITDDKKIETLTGPGSHEGSTVGKSIALGTQSAYFGLVCEITMAIVLK